MPNDNSPAHGGGEQGEQLEGSLTDGGSLPGSAHRDEDRSFGAGKSHRELGDEQEGKDMDAQPGGGTSGSTGASSAPTPGGSPNADSRGA